MEDTIRRPTLTTKRMREVDTKLDLSESFYSVQCEGTSTGYPAYFIRLKGCNLMCGGTGGKLMKEGKATWWCDTEAVWKKGFGVPFFKLKQKWDQEGITDWVLSGRVHLIWTGGEPTIPKHQNSIPAFLDWLEDSEPEAKTFNEIETRRINPEALERIMSHDNYWFKFVISTEECLKEIERDFIQPFGIPHDKVLMMPGLDSRKDYHERTRFCLEMAKKYGYIGLSRLHVSAWDKLTGV